MAERCVSTVNALSVVNGSRKRNPMLPEGANLDARDDCPEDPIAMRAMASARVTIDRPMSVHLAQKFHTAFLSAFSNLFPAGAMAVEWRRGG